jgi:hypothetical protein
MGAGQLTKFARRETLVRSHVSGALWAVGNGLTTGPVLTFLVIDLGARGPGVSVMLAVPVLAGLLRLAAPRLLAAVGSYRRAAIRVLTASYLLAWGVPLAALVEGWGPTARLAVVLGLLAVHQGLEYLGQVTVWAWLGELTPRRLRGRLFARRQRWQLAATLPSAVGGALLIDYLRTAPGATPAAILWSYAAPMLAGAGFLSASLLPLRKMADVRWSPLAAAAAPTVSIGAAMSNRPLRRMLLWGLWFSFFNGLTQTAQNWFPKQVLRLDVLPLVLMRGGMMLGQFGLSGPCGRFVDRFGNRPLMIVCQAVVAMGFLFYLQASALSPWWIAGAWLLWSAYAGINVAIPSLALKLAPAAGGAAYLATFQAVSSLAYAGSTLLGGWWFMSLEYATFAVGGFVMDCSAYFFYLGWATRLLGVLFLLGLIEPGAWKWGEILRGKRDAAAETSA